MANEEILKTNTTPVQATTNPQTNVEQLQPNNAINIPLQIQPIIAQPTSPTQPVQNNTQNMQSLQTNVNTTVPTPVKAQPQANNYNYDFSNYKSNSSNNVSQFNPIVLDSNNNMTEYKSQYSSAINQLANQILNMRFAYNPNEDDLLQQATKYTTQNTFESMNSKGILNSSLTAERVTRVVGELIPTYEKMAREEFESNFNMLMNTAQLIMNLDDSQYQKWQADREMQWEKEKVEYEKEMNAIAQAWERVDELGYVDNKASIILGVPVGTLSKSAREAKEQREYELETWYKQQEAQAKAEKELLLLKNDLEKELYTYQYQLENSTTTNNKTISQNTYDEIIKNRFAVYDEASKQYVVSTTDGTSKALEQYLYNEIIAGRMNMYDAKILMDKYGISTAMLNGSNSKFVQQANSAISKAVNPTQALSNANNNISNNSNNSSNNINSNTKNSDNINIKMSNNAIQWLNQLRSIINSKNSIGASNVIKAKLTSAVRSGKLTDNEVNTILATALKEGSLTQTDVKTILSNLGDE